MGRSAIATPWDDPVSEPSCVIRLTLCRDSDVVTVVFPLVRTIDNPCHPPFLGSRLMVGVGTVGPDTQSAATTDRTSYDPTANIQFPNAPTTTTTTRPSAPNAITPTAPPRDVVWFFSKINGECLALALWGGRTTRLNGPRHCCCCWPRRSLHTCP